MVAGSMKLFGSSLVLALLFFLATPCLAKSIADDLIIIDGVSHVPVAVADHDLYGLILAAQKWFSNYTKLNTEVPLPQVKFASEEYMNALHEAATGITPDPDRPTLAMMFHHPVAEGEDLYFMFFLKRFEKTNLVDQSILFHETVHNVQYRNAVPWCRDTMEGQAYFYQGLWLKTHGSEWDTIGNNLILRGSELLKKKCDEEPVAPITGRREEGDGP
jgi:hypothetical protein